MAVSAMGREPWSKPWLEKDQEFITKDKPQLNGLLSSSGIVSAGMPAVNHDEQVKLEKFRESRVLRLIVEEN